MPGFLHRVRRPHREDGGIAIFVAICVVALLGIVGLVVDGGGKLRATMRADAAATEAARAGGQAIDPGQAIPGDAVVADPGAARAAAQAYLRRAGIPGSVTVSGDGKTLTVTTSTSYATKFLPAVGIGSLPVTGEGQASLVHGVVSPQEGP
ncbi:pilus assembly protein TadG-related protein [Streptomyces sp. 8N706]|uniref:pilus assembly protein TadG-related protein n=1 Tax=Streptomyces sp. 8N706 TaxID=3457416 RepID=UPI003FD3813A